MRKTIFKYPITIATQVFIQMPMGAEPIHFGLDPMGIPCLWAIVDPSAPVIRRKFCVVGTGHPDITPLMKYIGTVCVSPYMWHLFRDMSDD